MTDTKQKETKKNDPHKPKIYKRTAQEQEFDRLWDDRNYFKRNQTFLPNSNTKLFYQLPLSDEGRAKLYKELMATQQS